MNLENNTHNLTGTNMKAPTNTINEIRESMNNAYAELIPTPIKRNIFSVPYSKTRSLKFNVPANLTPKSFSKINNSLLDSLGLDENKDRKKIAALAAIVLLQHFGFIVSLVFKPILKRLLMQNVDTGKQLALIDLLYSRYINDVQLIINELKPNR